MTTVKPSAARRSATAAPMPREAPVTIATLLDSFVILSSLGLSRVCPRLDEENLNPSDIRIIMRYPAIQSGKDEQSDGPIRGDADFHPGGGAAQFYDRGGRSGRAAVDRNRRGEDPGGAARRAASRAHHTNRPPDPRRRGALPALPGVDRRPRRCGRCLRRRQAERIVA